MPAPAAQIAFDDFMKVDVRVGQVLAVDSFPEARKPAWKLTIDFGLLPQFL
jgi:tRNA-binding protein